MSVSSVLMQVATMLAATGCSTTSSGPQRDLDVSNSDACTILAQGGAAATVFGSTKCYEVCGPPFGVCTFPPDFVAAYNAENPNAGRSFYDASAPACPAAQSVHVLCQVDGTGRHTTGASDFSGSASNRLGGFFARSAHFEAVSVHAFRRLAAELRSHGAPADLCVAADRAADEESVHATKMDALAARFGATREPARLCTEPTPRPLLEVALENAVEGCVRETYGAAVCVVRACRATCPEIAATFAALACDECGHAELSWRVLAWHLTVLDEAAHLKIARAMNAARRRLSEEIARAGGAGLSDADEAFLGMPSAPEGQLLLDALEQRVFFRAA